MLCTLCFGISPPKIITGFVSFGFGFAVLIGGGVCLGRGRGDGSDIPIVSCSFGLWTCFGFRPVQPALCAPICYQKEHDLHPGREAALHGMHGFLSEKRLRRISKI